MALTAAVRTLGGAIGFAILESILESGSKAKVPKSVGVYVLKAGLPKTHVAEFVEAYLNNPTSVEKIPGVNTTILKAAKLGARWGYADSVRPDFYTLAAFGVLAAALCLGLPNVSKFMTNKVVTPARGGSIRNTFNQQRSTRK